MHRTITFFIRMLISLVRFVVICLFTCKVDRFVKIFIVNLVINISIATCLNIAIIESQYRCSGCLGISRAASHLSLISSNRQLRNKERDIVH